MLKVRVEALGWGIACIGWLAPGLAGAEEQAAAGLERAEQVGSSNGRTPLQISLATGVTASSGEVWEAEDDTASRGDPLTFVDVVLSPSFRVTRDFAFGLRAGLGVDPRSSVLDAEVHHRRSLLQLGGLGRYQAEPGQGFYFASHIGALALIDEADRETYWDWALHLGVALGYELALDELVSLGLELRASHAENGQGIESDRYEYETATWLGAALVTSFMP